MSKTDYLTLGVLGRELIKEQLAERKKKLAEKTLKPCTQEKHF